jgi:hypothetical protein
MLGSRTNRNVCIPLFKHNFYNIHIQTDLCHCKISQFYWVAAIQMMSAAASIYIQRLHPKSGAGKISILIDLGPSLLLEDKNNISLYVEQL